MQSLFWSNSIADIHGAFIIRLKDNEKSIRLADRCATSCERVGQKYQFWDAYDGISNPITKPDHHNDVMDLIKVTDHYMTRGEVACALSHISLWVKCIKLDKPIVILEHDAIMLKPYTIHPLYNSIGYLGGGEQYFKGWAVSSVPPYASDGPNYKFICRAHAYAIDPIVAKNMVAHAIKMGIDAPLDIMLRGDLFQIHQFDLYAYDKPDGTTILERPKTGRTTIKNDSLEI
jgi:hypothetical protein